MLAAITGTSTSSAPMQPSEGDQQLLDLESLSQRLRALEVLLAPPQPQQQASSSGSGGGGGATGNESPTEDNTEDIVSTSTPSPQSSPSTGRRDHHHHSHHHSHHHKSLVSSKDPLHTPGSLSRRVQKIETSFWAAAKERKPSFEEFLQKYESSNLMNSPYSSHSDRELLTLQAKTELILAAQEELQQLAEESKDIQSLQRCAEIGGLKNVESQYPVLSQLETVHIEHSQEANKVSDKMNKLTDDYNTLINTLSEVFLSWDALLSAAELKVAEVERSKN
ncbi:hypothetical protein BGZ74_010851 [Mortierella antarctica]|nr:hypothetical protein BGZ74_010851 [Mortierella antarctica]KAG0355626.1 hypothetical protein BG005_005426 [Podila minutissima]